MTFHEIRERSGQVRAIPLEAVLRVTGAEHDRRDWAKWHTAQGVLSVSGMKFMNWNQGLGGGGAIDLVIHLKDLRFKAAVEWLCRQFPRPPSPPQAPPPPGPDFQRPLEDSGKLSRVIHYLSGDRGIPFSVIKPLIESGRLYADHRANAVFLLLGKGNTPVGAELRGTGDRPWRGLAPGSRKDLGYFSVPAPDAAAIVLCESAIDAISFFALRSTSTPSTNLPDRLCISTSGARPDPRWLTPLLHQGHQVYCAFDSDTTGDRMADAMIALHPTVRRLRPALHDWNALLVSPS